MKYCTKCGTRLADDAKFCSNCGASQEENSNFSEEHKQENVYVATPSNSYSSSSSLSRGLATILCGLAFICPVCGIHRFYVGKIGTGILWLLTAGLFGIGQLVDLIMIICGSFTDADGKELTDWTIK